MTLTKMLFTKYCALHYPTKRGEEKRLLPPGVAYYAVPGGGVATEDACRLWGLENKVVVSFNDFNYQGETK